MVRPHIVFRNLLTAFNVRSFASLASIAGWDASHVSKMRSGKVRISPRFFLRLCIAKNWTPKQMSEETGIPLDYFEDDEE